MVEEESEYLKLPIEDRCIHKLWKARKNGYEEAIKLFSRYDGSDPNWKKFNLQIKKFVADSNVVAQEKGLEATLVFVENCDLAGKTTADVIEGIVTKCIGAPKARTKELALSIILMYIEIEKVDIVLDELTKGISHKNPKVVSGTVNSLTECLREFGPKVLKISPLLKVIVPLLDHRDKDVREQGKKFIVQSYSWVGDILKQQLTSLKPVQSSELEAEFEKIEKKTRPTRYLRSQQPTTIQATSQDQDRADDQEVDAENDEEPNEDLDPYDLLDPVEILSKLPKNFYELLQEKKWTLRKEALDALLELTKSSKLKVDDYGDVTKELKRTIAKDTNVNLVILAAQCLAGLARGLRTSFKQLGQSCFSVVIEKLKEKKLTVVTALRDAADALFSCLGIEVIQEDILEALKHKNPCVKAEICAFLTRCVILCPSPLYTNKKLVKSYILALLEKVSESDSAIRENAFEALGAFYKLIGEKDVSKLLQDIDNIKLGKIKDYAEKIELKGKPVVKAKPPPPKPEVKKVMGRAPVSKPASKPSNASSNAGANKVVKGGAKKVKKEDLKSNNVNELKTEAALSVEESEEIFSNDYSVQINSLSDSNWKVRLAAFEELEPLVDTKSDFNMLATLTAICKKPGLKDNNFQVLAAKLRLIKAVIDKKGSFTQQCWDVLQPDIVEKLGDAKNYCLCKEVLFSIADVSSFSFLHADVLKIAFSFKNPKVKTESANWVSEAIQLYGLAGVSTKIALEKIKEGLVDTNPAVRTASISLLAILHWYLGPVIRRVFDDMKPQLLSQIDAEIQKYANKSPPPVSRGPTLSRENQNLEEAESDEAVAEVEAEDILPRKNISSKISDNLLSKLRDKNWKVRKEGLDEINAIITEAKFITDDLGELPTVLSEKFTDSNANLKIFSLTICKDIAICLGSHSRKHISNFLPGILASLADSKSNARQAGISALNEFLQQGKQLKEFFVNEIFSSALAKSNPFQKQEIFGWLAVELKNYKGIPKDELSACLNTLYLSVEDRDPEVRRMSQEAFLGFMTHLGYESMRRVAEKLPPSNKNVILPLLEKTRPLVPQQEKAKTIKTAGSQRPPSETKSSVSVETSKAIKSRQPAVAKPTGKKKADIDTSPPYNENNLKHARFKDEQKLKLLKWNFTSVRQEFVDQLNEQISAANFNKSLTTQMFHSDFKQHLKAIELLSNYLHTDVDALICNLDLILKWLTLRFFETNPAVIVKGLDYVNNIFNTLSNNNYQLHDIEANSFIPYLIGKLGEAKDIIRNSTKNIIKSICLVYPSSKIFPFLLNGLASKNSRQRAECLDEMEVMIQTTGMHVCQPSIKTSIQEMARQIADRDNSVRNAALNVVTEAYFQEGEKLFKLIGNISEKDMAMLEERIKRSGKNRKVKEIESNPQKVAPKVTNVKSIKVQERQRPTNGSADILNNMPKSSRPVSAAFSLDLAKIEATAGNLNDTSLKLVKHDWDEVLDHVHLPPTRTGAVRLTTNSSSLNSANLYAELDINLSQILSHDYDICTHGISKVDELLKDKSKVMLLEKRIDQLLVACYMQFRHIYGTRMLSNNYNSVETMNLFEYLTMILMSLYHYNDLVKLASKSCIHDMLHVIISILVDKRITELKYGSQLSRGLNVLTVKIVDKSDHTYITCALLNLLQSSVGAVLIPPQFGELVMKCIWKVIRFLPTPAWIDSLDLGSILLELHNFLKAFPSSYWKTQESDTALRTVKTIVHSLAKLKGQYLLTFLNKINDPENSELVSYLHRVLANLNSEDGQIRTSHTSIKKKRLSKTTHETLVEIFKKIGDKEQTKDGLNELYNFKHHSPDADLEPFLSKSSKFFRDYIENALKEIEGKKVIERLNTKESNDNIKEIALNVGGPNVYMEKLKRLREQGGLEKDLNEKNNIPNEKTEDRFTVNKGVLSEVTDNNDEESKYKWNSGEDVEDIRKRLEKLKKSALY